MREAAAAWKAADTTFDFNRAASALLVTWREQLLLLGSDLIEEPGRGWSRAVERTPELVGHCVYKVAHHGSRAAQDEGVVKKKGGSSVFVITPFASQNLPRFSDGEGVAWLQKYAPEVALTALPRKYAEQSGVPSIYSRRFLAKHARTIAFDPPAPGFPDCYVVLELEPSGGAPSIKYGPGSVRVTGSPATSTGTRRKRASPRPARRQVSKKKRR